MTTATTTPAATTLDVPVRRRRTAGVLAATAAGLAVWLIVTAALGVELEATGVGAVSWPSVIAAGLLAGFSGWGLLAALERAGKPAGRWWTVIAVTVLVLSLPAPLVQGATLAAGVGLVTLHLAVGAVLIPMLARTARR
ncbi:DUF6069 family protein [Georgenia subflava]|uniref:Uncharacterized protein n=1 Tax=Georgenia subflava TaxID=1622177 RepID=A0A6N7ELA2_9MICO|nr:DUF6069 family protein [Georgenia subflava]MPV37868.1 hypothetical protein [Georgenia subflava]